jgi:hypothetical protein
VTDKPITPNRKKSQKRQRRLRIVANCTADEFNAVAEKAKAAGMSQSAYARAVLLGSPGPRAQRRLSVDADLLRQVLALHGKYGSNMNQIAYQLNKQADHAGAVKYEEGLHDWAIIRDATLAALGKPPKGSHRPA